VVIVKLPAYCTFLEWRLEARALIQNDIQPKHIEWHAADSEADLLWALTPESSNRSDTNVVNVNCDIEGTAAITSSESTPIMVPATFVRYGKLAICHKSKDKFDLLYRLLWRISHDEPHILNMAMDADVKKLGIYCKSVRRDLHKMTAFVRFDRVAKSPNQLFKTEHSDSLLNIAEPLNEQVFYSWFEPEHNVLAQAGEFFKKRFSNSTWTIATPIGSIHWDTARLTIDHSTLREKPELHDGVVALWDTYYASIFNPGRIKLKAMHAEMPRKYWHNMPETRQISALASEAPARKQSMLAAEPSTPPRWAKKATKQN